VIIGEGCMGEPTGVLKNTAVAAIEIIVPRPSWNKFEASRNSTIWRHWHMICIYAGFGVLTATYRTAAYRHPNATKTY
jgi:hypothetical protein